MLENALSGNYEESEITFLSLYPYLQKSWLGLFWVEIHSILILVELGSVVLVWSFDEPTCKQMGENINVLAEVNILHMVYKITLKVWNHCTYCCIKLHVYVNAWLRAKTHSFTCTFKHLQSAPRLKTDMCLWLRLRWVQNCGCKSWDRTWGGILLTEYNTLKIKHKL